MSLDKAKLCDSLLNWLQTFQAPTCASKQDLTSGVLLARVLHRIDSSWFSETWLSRIKDECDTNWRLKVSNLKKILQSMLEYYHDVLGHQVSDDHLPDVSLIGEMGDVVELAKLVQLVLGCAVSCEKKQEYIQQIMTLEESVQHILMTSIQELLTKESTEAGTPETYGDFDYQSRKYYFLSEEMEEEREHLNKRCWDLEHQLSAVSEERAALQAEIRALKEKLSCCNPSDVSSTITSKKLLLLQSQMEQLQEENYRLESARDDIRVQAELLERKVFELQQRNKELTSLAQEAEALKDEMDILRHSSERVSSLEALVESYKRKLEDLGDLRQQVRLLEERNTVYMQRTCELEQEQHSISVVRGQLDIYKKQLHELQAKHSAEAVKAEKWQFEYKNLLDKYKSLQKEKECLILERDALREASDELRCAQVQKTLLSHEDSLCDDSSASVGNLASEIMLTEFKETLARLRNENRMLRVQDDGYRQQLAKAQSQLEEWQRRHNALETQNRLDQQQISELRCQVEELQQALQVQASKAEDSSMLKKKLEEHLEKLHEAHSDLRKKREVIDDLEPDVDSNMAKKISELQEVLRKKDEDMKQMEERYKQYMEKAQMVIKIVDPKKLPMSVSPEMQMLRKQLNEKEKKIQHLEQDFEKSKSRREQEEKLIINAWYNMGMALHHRIAGEGSGPPSQAQSFLAQQRQATYTRRGLSLRLQHR